LRTGLPSGRRGDLVSAPGKDSEKIRKRRAPTAGGEGQKCVMLDEMTAGRVTSEPRAHYEEAAPSRLGGASGSREGRSTQLGRSGRPSSRPSRRAHAAALHWPSWQSHRSYVRARRADRRLRRSRRRTWPGRHPVAVGTLAVLVLLTPIWVSLGSALTNPALGLSTSARLAEWMRDNGAGSLVNSVENWWYSHHPPPVGGVPSAVALPSQLGRSAARSTPLADGSAAYLPAPAPLKPFAQPVLAGEGIWRPVGRQVRGVPAVYETFLRPDAVHTSVVDGIAWLDTRLLSATLYSGSYIPGGGPYRYTAPVLPLAARSLVVAFNAGFRMQDSNGGYYTQGRAIIPLRNGAASFVIYRNGTATVGAWGSGPLKMNRDVVAVRQNLRLLVDNGRPVPRLNANDTTRWGNTLGNQVFVSRSGIGVTRNGALVYVGGPNLNITDLANLLARAGAVRAMELDINTDWVNLATFDPSTPTGLASPGNGTDLLPLADMSAGPSRYFTSWWARDFITMSARWP